ncbi:kif2a, partial [Symbiodinium sp. CCMP2456]
KTPFVQHLTFDFDQVFDGQVHSEDVYRRAAEQLVRRSRVGGVGTMFMFGQTGSGKTHTMTAIQ